MHTGTIGRHRQQTNNQRDIHTYTDDYSLNAFLFKSLNITEAVNKCSKLRKVITTDT